MVPQYLLVLVLAVAVSARTAASTQDASDDNDSALGDIKIAYETYKDCGDKELLLSCLKRKLAKSLTRLGNSEEITILNGVTITKNQDVPVRDHEAVPRGLDEGSLDNFIMDKIFDFMQTHTIKVSLFCTILPNIPNHLSPNKLYSI